MSYIFLNAQMPISYFYQCWKQFLRKLWSSTIQKFGVIIILKKIKKLTIEKWIKHYFFFILFSQDAINSEVTVKHL